MRSNDKEFTEQALRYASKECKVNVLYDIVIIIAFCITVTLFIGVVSVFPKQINRIEKTVARDDPLRDKKWLNKYLSYTLSAYIIQSISGKTVYMMCYLDSVTDDLVAPAFALIAYMTAVTAGLVFFVKFVFKVNKYKINWPNIWYSNGIGFCGFFYGVPLGVAFVLSMYVFTNVFLL